MCRFSGIVAIAAYLFLISEPGLLGQNASIAAGAPSPESEKKGDAESLRNELMNMGEQDQLHRGELQATAIEMAKTGTTVPTEAFLVLQKKVDAIDKRNLARLEQIIVL